MNPRCVYSGRYMVSPCGRVADFYSAGSAPAGYTDCSDMSDTEVGQLMVRRMWANSKEEV